LGGLIYSVFEGFYIFETNVKYFSHSVLMICLVAHVQTAPLSVPVNKQPF